MKIIGRIDDHLEEVMLVFLMTYFVFVVVAQVIARFVLQVPAAWTEETGRYAFIWLTFIGASYATKKGMHIRMDIMESYLGPIAAGRLKLLSMLIFLAFLLIMSGIGLSVCQTLLAKPQKSPVLGLPMLAVYAAMPVGMILSAIRMLQWFYLELYKKKTAGI
ncbi:MAG: TRAP transporter small permease [Clostridiales bacterium]